MVRALPTSFAVGGDDAKSQACHAHGATPEASRQRGGYVIVCRSAPESGKYTINTFKTQTERTSSHDSTPQARGQPSGRRPGKHHGRRDRHASDPHRHRAEPCCVSPPAACGLAPTKTHRKSRIITLMRFRARGQAQLHTVYTRIQNELAQDEEIPGAARNATLQGGPHASSPRGAQRGL